MQDDTLALAILDAAAGSIEPILLPDGPDGARAFDDLRGNKAFKLDLEACIALPDGREVSETARCSDAIALALHVRADVLVDPGVIDACVPPPMHELSATSSDLESLADAAFGKWKM